MHAAGQRAGRNCIRTALRIIAVVTLGTAVPFAPARAVRPTANAFVTEQTASAFPARVMATHVRDAAGKGRPRLINLEHLAALDAMEIINALYNRDSFGGALAAGADHLLHDGRIHPHPSGPRHHRDSSASDPRSTDLSPQLPEEMLCTSALR
jgi:hypothetical protein